MQNARGPHLVSPGLWGHVSFYGPEGQDPETPSGGSHTQGKYRWAFPCCLSFSRQHSFSMFAEGEALLLWLGLISHDGPDRGPHPPLDWITLGA